MSSQQCKQTIDSTGLLHRILCSERRHFRPLQAGEEEGGAVSTTSQDIRFLRHSAMSAAQPRFTRRLSLQFEPVETDLLNKETAMENIQQILHRFCQHSVNGFQPDTSRDFWELVTRMRQLDLSSLKNLYESVSGISLCPNITYVRKTVQDALVMTGSEDSVRLMSKLLIAGDVRGLQARLWLTSLGLLPAVTENMLNDAKALLDSAPLTLDTLLPTSSMVKTYCQRREDCGSHPSVSGIMLALKRFIGVTCDVDKMTMEKIVRGLRAVGNAGQAAHVQDVLDNCVKRKYFLEVRLAALQALYHMPCSIDRTRAEGIFHDLNEDWEVRIASYLVIMQCPTPRLLAAVHTMTTAEKNEQVRSFVKSHVVNLLKKARSQGQEAPSYLSDEDFSPWEKEDQNFLTSKNIYASFFSDHHELGIHVDADVLWPSSSSLPFSLLTSGSSNTSLPWLPRSASLNVAVDAFGQKWNLLEAGIRGEGLEFLLETFISPYLPGARSSFKRPFKAETASASGYVRFLDRDMAFFRAQELAPARGALPFGFNWMSALSSLSGEGDHTFTQSFILTDILIAVPTSSGLPLTLGLNSSASVELRVSGKLDIQVQTARPRDLHISGNIRASGIMSLTGTMAIDAMVTRVGLIVSGVARSSTTLGGHVILDKGQSLRVQLDVPQDQMDIVDVRSEFALLHNSIKEALQPPGLTSGVRRMCTGAYTARIAGLELCGHLQVPRSLTGWTPYRPFALSVTLRKTDTHSSYSLLARYVQKPQSIITLLEIKTPESQVDRGIGFDLLGDITDPKDVRVHLGFTSPWKSAKVTGSVTNTPLLKSVTCRLIIDKAVTYAVTAEVKVSRSKLDVTYFPLLEIRRPGFPEWSVKGVVSVQSHWKSLKADVSVQGVVQFPLILKASIINTNHEKSVKFTAYNDAGLSYTVAAGTSFTFIGKEASRADVDYFFVFTTPTQELVSLSGSGGYKPGQMLKTDLKLTVDKHKPLLFQCLMTKAKRRSDLLYNLELSLKSAVAELVLAVTVDVTRGRVLSSRVTLTHNVPSFLPRDKVTLGAKATDHSTYVTKSYYITINVDSVANPDYCFSLKLFGEHRPRQTEAEVVFKHGKERKNPENQIAFSGKVKHDAISVTKASLGYKVLVTAPGQDIEIHLKGHHIHTTRYLDSACEMTYGTGQRARAHLTFRDRSSTLLTLTGEVKVEAPGADVSAKTTLIQKNPKHFVHSISYKQGEERKDSMTTVVRVSDERSFSVSSDIHIHKWQGIKVIGETRLVDRNFQTAGSLTYGDKQYGGSAISILDSNVKHKFKASLFYPGELYSLLTIAEQRQDSYHGNMKLEMEGEDNIHRKLFVVTGSLHLSPKAKKDYRKLKLVAQTFGMRGFLTVDNELTQFRARGRMFRGRKKSSYSTTLEVKKPISVDHLELLWTTLTPDRDCHRMEIEVLHSMHPSVTDMLERVMEGLSQLIERQGWKAATGPHVSQETRLVTELPENTTRSLSQYTDENKQPDELESDRQGQIMDMVRADIQTGVHVKWTVDEPVDVLLGFTHKHDASLYEKIFKLDGKSENYTIALTLNHQLGDVRTYGAAELDFVIPGRTAAAQWQLENAGTKIQSNVTWSWSPANEVNFQIHGHRDASKHHELVGDVILQTPWHPIRDWGLSLLQAHASDSFRSKSSLRRSGVEIASHRVYAFFTPSFSDANITIVTPWSSKFSGTFQGQNNSMTLTCSADVCWTPRDRISADGRLALKTWDDVSAVLRLETSFPGARVIAYELSSTNTGHGTNSFMIFKLGSGRTYGVETLFRKNPAFIRLKVQSPFENFRVLEAGLQATGNLTKMKVNADFRVYPVISKCHCLLEWSYDPDLLVKVRIDTPLKVFPGVELTTRLNSMGSKHISHLSLHLLPSASYTVNAELSFNAPLVVSLEAKTADEGFKQLGTANKHQINQSLVAAELEVFYPRHQMFEMKVMIDSNNTVNGSAVVRTTFGGFRECYAMFWHEGSLEDFSVRGKVVLPSDLTAFFVSETDEPQSKSSSASFGTQNENKTFHFVSIGRVGETDVLDADVNYTISHEVVELALNIHYETSNDVDISATDWRLSDNITSFFLASLRYGNAVLCDANITVSGRTSGLLKSPTIQSSNGTFAEPLALLRDRNVSARAGPPVMTSFAPRIHLPLADLSGHANFDSTHNTDADDSNQENEIVTEGHDHDIPKLSGNHLSGNRPKYKDAQNKVQDTDDVANKYDQDLREYSNNILTDMFSNETVFNLNVDLKFGSAKPLGRLDIVLSAEKRLENGEMLISFDGGYSEENSGWILSTQNKRRAENSSMDIMLKFIRPIDNVVPTYRTSLRKTVDGQFGRHDVIFSSRLFYVHHPNVSVPGCCQDHRLRIAFGGLTRSFEIDGAWSEKVSSTPQKDPEVGAEMNQIRKVLHVAFFWDPHHNRSKCVTFESALSTGDVTTMDVALTSPAQELRLKHKLQANVFSWVTTTSFSYSPDPRKTVIMTTRCSRSSMPHRLLNEKDHLDLSSKENLPETLNYTVFLRVEHPHSDLDLALTSCVSAEETDYTGDLEMWYLTAQRHRKYVSTHAAIRQMGRQVQAQVRTSGMVWEVQANLSDSPHIKFLAGHYDNITQATTMTSEMTIDRHQRKIVLRLAGPSDRPDHELVFEGKYVNYSFVRAVLRHYHVTEGLVTIGLNTSTLLHTRVYWRPETLETFKELVISSLVNADFLMRRRFQQISEAIGDEMAARYSRLTDDVTPWLALYLGELDLILENLQTFFQALLANKIGVENFKVGERNDPGVILYEILRTSGSQLSKQGRQLLKMIQTLAGNVMQEILKHLAFSARDVAKVGVTKGARALLRLLAELDGHLQEVTRRVESNLLKKSSDLDRRKNCSARPTYRAVVTSLVSKLQFGFRSIASTLSRLQLYYKVHGTWLEDNLKTVQAIGSHLNSIALTLQKLVSSELAHRMAHFRCFESTRFTVWRPQEGEVQAEICLPVALRRLDTWPSVGDYVASMYTAVLSYTQSNSTGEHPESKPLVRQLDEEC